MIHSITIVLLVALLALRPHSPQLPCIDARRERIASDATRAAEAHGVPAAILLTVGFNETHLGCDRREGGNWGAPADRNHRHTAGTADNAASALALGYRRCRTWLGAVAHFRTGRCNGVPRVGYTPSAVMRRARQIDPALR